MAKDWYVRQDAKVYGPIATEKLKSLVAESKITTQAEVSNEKDGPWHPITKLKGLAFPGTTDSRPATPAESSRKSTVASSQNLLVPPPTSSVRNQNPHYHATENVADSSSYAPPPTLPPLVGTNPVIPQRSTSNDTRALLHYQANAKSAGIAYALWFFLGMWGAHRFYSGKAGSGAAQLLITLVSIPLCFVLIGFLTIIANAIWVLVDVFLISGWVRDYNSRLAHLVAP